MIQVPGTRRVSLFFLFLSALLCFIMTPASAVESLLGRWNCVSGMDALELEFRSGSSLIFDGEPMRYALLPGFIRVWEEHGMIDYPYLLNGDVLSIQFPDGTTLGCERRAAEQTTTSGIREAPAVVSPPPPSSERDATAGMSEGMVGDPAWGFSFTLPQGWTHRKDASGAVLGHSTIAGMILIFPHQVGNLTSLRHQMQEGLVEEGVRLRPAGDLRLKGNNLITGRYGGVVQGKEAKGMGIGTLSPHGGGAYILAVSTPEKFGREISDAAHAIAGKMVYVKVDTSHLTRIFVGRWASYSGVSGAGTLMNYTFYADGTFTDSSESSYASEYSGDGWGIPDSYMGAVGTESGRGRWNVRGTDRQGQITLTAPDGSERVLDYEVYVEKGHTYWREYLLNGRHFRKQGD